MRLIDRALTLSRRQYVLLAAGGSLVILAMAFAFQHIGGLAPCAMCLWQRWPNAIAIALGAVGLFRPQTLVLLAGGVTMLVNAGIALYHSGVERHWWLGPQSCTSRGTELGSMSVDDLLNPDIGSAVVLCDEIPWQLLGLSMANYNIAAGVALAAIWFIAARRPEPRD